MELKNAVISKKNELWKVKADYLMSDKESWFARALMEIGDNKNLEEVAKTNEGMDSILKSLGKALQMGLMIGGTIPHCYLVPQQGKARLDITMDGYKFAATSGKSPVIKDIEVRAVYEKEAESLEIDFATNTVRGHKAYLMGNRGKLIGVYGIITHLDNRNTVKWMPVDDINRIRDNYSQSFKGNANMSPWTKEYEKMAIKTAGKQFLKEFASRKESLEMAFVSEEITAPETPADRIIEVSAKVEKAKTTTKKPLFDGGDEL